MVKSVHLVKSLVNILGSRNNTSAMNINTPEILCIQRNLHKSKIEAYKKAVEEAEQKSKLIERTSPLSCVRESQQDMINKLEGLQYHQERLIATMSTIRRNAGNNFDKVIEQSNKIIELTEKLEELVRHLNLLGIVDLGEEDETERNNPYINEYVSTYKCYMNQLNVALLNKQYYSDICDTYEEFAIL